MFIHFIYKYSFINLDCQTYLFARFVNLQNRKTCKIWSSLDIKHSETWKPNGKPWRSSRLNGQYSKHFISTHCIVKKLLR